MSSNLLCGAQPNDLGHSHGTPEMYARANVIFQECSILRETGAEIDLPESLVGNRPFFATSTFCVLFRDKATALLYSAVSNISSALCVAFLHFKH